MVIYNIIRRSYEIFSIYLVRNISLPSYIVEKVYIVDYFNIYTKHSFILIQFFRVMSDEECTTANVTNKPDHGGDNNNVTTSSDGVTMSLDSSSELFSGSVNDNGDPKATEVAPEDERNIGQTIPVPDMDGSHTPTVVCEESESSSEPVAPFDGVIETAIPDGTAVLVEEIMTEPRNDGGCKTSMYSGRLRPRSSRRLNDRRNMTRRRPSEGSGDACDNVVNIRSTIRPQLTVRRGITGGQCTSPSSDHTSEYDSGDRWRSCQNVQANKVLLAAKGHANPSGQRDRSSTRGRRKPRSSRMRPS